jgi:hypothetical protein
VEVLIDLIHLEELMRALRATQFFCFGGLSDKE